MHNTFIVMLVICPALAAANLFWGWMALTSFLREHPKITNGGDMDRFKQMAASQMYQGFVQVLLVFLPVIFFFGGLLTQNLTTRDFLYVIIPFCMVVSFGLYVKNMERQVQTTPALTAELERERDAVVKTWLTKPFPDWPS